MINDTSCEAGSILTIDLDALAANYRFLTAHAAPAICAPTVKANAYGIGLEQTVQTLTKAGAQIFFVALLQEARRVQAVNPHAIIYVLNGLFPGTAATHADLSIRPVLCSWPEIIAWSDLCRVRGTRYPAALHLDTGMNRLGLSYTEIQKIAADQDLKSLFQDCLLISHFINAEEWISPLNARQMADFESAHQLLPTPYTSVNNSSSMFPRYRNKGHIVRPGYALFGGNPTPNTLNPMCTVVKLQARIIQLRTVTSGESIGYNAGWIAPCERRIATLSMGYGDGYPYAAGWTGSQPRGMVSIMGVRCPIVGAISMDLMNVDVTAVPDSVIEPGDFAEIIGDTISLEEVAAWGQTIGYEILTRLGSRHARRYVSSNITET